MNEYKVIANNLIKAMSYLNREIKEFVNREKFTDEKTAECLALVTETAETSEYENLKEVAKNYLNIRNAVIVERNQPENRKALYYEWYLLRDLESMEMRLDIQTNATVIG